jgi:excisionase family DNA binding protein
MTTVTLSELAARLGVAESTLRKAIAQGRLTARKSGKVWLFDDEHQAAAAAIVPGRGQHWRQKRAE